MLYYRRRNRTSNATDKVEVVEKQKEETKVKKGKKKATEEK